jgi:hypothetical protein
VKRLNYDKFSILIENVPAYSFGSMDNRKIYSHEFRVDNEPYQPSSLHAVRVFSIEDQTEVADCILGSTGGASGIHENSAIINEASLVIAVGPFMVSLSLPDLKLNWKTLTDDATCFGVYHSKKNRCYISHGELDVARVSYDGVIEWTNSGADIFTNGFTVTDNQVEAIDWNEKLYVWDIQTGKPVNAMPNNSMNTDL